MYIHEAIRKAQEVPSIIRRPCFGRSYILVPGNVRDWLYGGAENHPGVMIGWEPMVEDLLADDWEVTRAEGIEWPAEAPTPAQRSWMHFLSDLLDNIRSQRRLERLCRHSRRRGGL